MRQAVRRSGLPISLSFITQKPLNLQLRKPLPPPCRTKCGCGNRSLCLKKDIIYDVRCNLCEDNDAYIGETGRTFNRRMMEHSTEDQSQVFQHFRRSHPTAAVSTNITTSIFASGFEDANHRRAYESNVIDTRNPPINVQHARK